LAGEFEVVITPNHAFVLVHPDNGGFKLVGHLQR
jgi:hypothetical protein